MFFSYQETNHIGIRPIKLTYIFLYLKQMIFLTSSLGYHFVYGVCENYLPYYCKKYLTKETQERRICLVYIYTKQGHSGRDVMMVVEVWSQKGSQSYIVQKLQSDKSVSFQLPFCIFFSPGHQDRERVNTPLG